MIDPLAMGAGFIAYNLVRIVVSLPKRREVRRRLGGAFVAVCAADPRPADAPYFPNRFGANPSRGDPRHAA
ncbi:MAG: hypothetical protein ACK4MV_21310 [Beijerinckiaceae bacterium]